MAGDGIAKLAYSHEAMVDAMVAHPTISGGELARIFGMTESWISRIRSSNAFRERLRERAMELVDPILVATIEENFDAMVARSVEVLNEQLSAPAQNIDPQLALQCAALGAKARGYGGFGARATTVVIPREPNWLEQQAHRLRSLNQGATDVDCHEVPVSREAGA